MSETVIERMARAIYEYDERRGGIKPKWPDRIIGGHIDNEYRGKAVAALKAMRIDNPQDDEHAFWNAMVNAAIADAE